MRRTKSTPLRFRKCFIALHLFQSGSAAEAIANSNNGATVYEHAERCDVGR